MTAPGYGGGVPTGPGSDPDSFTTAGYSPISVSTAIRASLSHGVERKIKQLEQNRKKRDVEQQDESTEGTGREHLELKRHDEPRLVCRTALKHREVCLTKPPDTSLH